MAGNFQLAGLGPQLAGLGQHMSGPPPGMGAPPPHFSPAPQFMGGHPGFPSPMGPPPGFTNMMAPVPMTGIRICNFNIFKLYVESKADKSTWFGKTPELPWQTFLYPGKIYAYIYLI